MSTKPPKVKFTPMNDRILIKRVEETTQTSGGIFIPELAQEKPPEGIVMAVGTGRYLESGTIVRPRLEVGDRVLLGKNRGADVLIDGREYLLMHETDVLGVLG